MTEAPETILQRRMMEQAQKIRELTAEISAARKAAAHWQGKATKGRNEIARLTREVEQLRADKRNLTFDINKQRKHVVQLQERVQ